MPEDYKIARERARTAKAALEKALAEYAAACLECAETSPTRPLDRLWQWRAGRLPVTVE